MTYAGRWLTTLLCGLGAALPLSAPASADPAEQCDAASLTKDTTVNARLRVEVHDLNAPKATSTVTIRVPETWSLSIALRADPRSDSYRLALRCLLDYEPADVRFAENRDRAPEVSVDDGFVSFTDVAYGDLGYDKDPIVVGEWSIDTSEVPWRAVLRTSPALANASLADVEVLTPRSWATGVFPWPPARADARKVGWRLSPADQEAPGVLITPDTRIRSSHLARHPGWNWVSNTLYWIFDAALLVLLAVALTRLRRRQDTRWSRRIVLAVTLLPLLRVLELFSYDVSRNWPFEVTWEWRDYAIGVVWVALAALTAWLVRLPHWLIVLFGGSLGLAVVAPPLLPDGLGGSGELSLRWIPRLVSAGLVTLMVSIAFAYTAQAVLRGRLPSRMRLRDFLRSRAGRWSLALSLPVTAAILLQRWIDVYADWSRTRWLQYPMDPVLRVFGDELAGYASSLGWQYGLAYAVAAVGVVPALRPVLDSDELSLPRHVRAVVCFAYALVVLPIGDSWAGWWFPAGRTAGLVIMFAVTGPLGRGNDPLWKALRTVRQEKLVTDARRWRVIEDRAAAREHAVAMADDAPHAGEKSKLRELFRLRRPARPATPPEAEPDMAELPAGVTPLDALFAVGPSRSAFRNGVTGAKFATYLGIPASVWLLWADWTTSPWLRPADQGMLITGLLGGACLTLLGWAAQGFALGVLWRRLPGRRGPGKALAMTAVVVPAYALDAVLNKAIDEAVDRTVLLTCALSFAILATTAVIMDLLTVRQLASMGFRPARTLLTAYRLGNVTTQATFALAQLAAILAIYSYVRNGGDAPPFPGIDPFGGGQRPGP